MIYETRTMRLLEEENERLQKSLNELSDTAIKLLKDYIEQKQINKKLMKELKERKDDQ